MRATLILPVVLACTGACARKPPSEPRTPAASPPASAEPATKRGDGTVVEIAGYRFDPRDGLPAVPSDLAAVEPGLWIVQLHDTRDRDALVAELSLSLSAYIPRSSYREVLTDAQVEAVRRDRRVRGVVGYPAAFKLSAALREPAGTDPGEAAVPLVVVCHPGAVASDTLAALRALQVGTVTEVPMPAGHPPRFRVSDLVPGAARRIASARGTVWIEPEGRIDED